MDEWMNFKNHRNVNIAGYFVTKEILLIVKV